MGSTVFNLQERLAFVVLMVVIASFAAACRCKSVTTSSPVDAEPGKTDRQHQSIDGSSDAFLKEIQAEYKLREELRKEFLSAASRLVEKADDADARELNVWLNANIVTVVPIGSEFIRFDQSRKDQPIRLLVITGNELDKFPDLKAMDEKRNAVGYCVPYSPAPPVMLLKYNKRNSELWNALLILHEASHARYYYTFLNNAPSKTGTEDAVDVDEVLAYELEHRLLDKLGGDKYTSLIQEQVKLLRQEGPEAPEDIQSERVRKLDLAFDEIFGPSDHDGLEREYLHYEFNLEAWFRYIDQKHPDKKGANEEKAKKYLELHREKVEE